MAEEISVEAIYAAAMQDLDMNRKMAANHQLQVEETIGDLAALDAIYGHNLEEMMGNLQ